MKPTFALDLTSDRIGLLHRTPKGWLSIGEVAFDAPDLPEALDYLRKTALGLSPMGIACKVVVPNGQILYTDVTAPGPSREDKRKQILTALEGRTPYNVEDLVFDWSGKGATVKVAVVARETLTEAEAFATEHRLNPVSFVAIPEAGSFVGEPWFGPTSAASTLLAEGETVDKDREPIVVLRRELPSADAGVEKSAEKPADEAVVQTVAAAPVAAAVHATVDESDDLLPGLEEALNAAVPDLAPAPSAEVPKASDPEPSDTTADDIETELTSMLAQDSDDLAKAEGPNPEPAKVEVEEAPFAEVAETPDFAAVFESAPTPPFGKSAGSVLDDDLPPAPAAAAMLAFASRRAVSGTDAAGADATARAVAKPIEDLPPLPRPSQIGATLNAQNPATNRPLPAFSQRTGPAKGFAGLVTAPSIPGTRKSKVKGLPSMPGLQNADASRPGMPGNKPLTKPGGTFATKTPQRGKPRFLGLILTGLLLVCLALVAAWSSFYLASDSQPQPTTAIVDATVPGVDDEMLADMQDPEGMSDPLPEAEGTASATAQADIGEGVAPDAIAAEEGALPEAAPINLALDEAPAEAVVEAQAEEPAPDTAVVTDVATAKPSPEDQDEIFLAAMDTPPPALDALALPSPEAVSDTLPEAPMPPPAYGTVYQFDANGLLKPTAEGILSPEGVMLIAGKPPLVPPPRSEVAIAAAEAAALLTPPLAEVPPPADIVVTDTVVTDTVVTDAALPPADPALKEFRPKPRPEGLLPAAASPEDDAALAVGADGGFARLRPLPRPTTVSAAAALANPAPAEAADLGAQAASLIAQNEATLAAVAAAEAANPSVVAISRRPMTRPRDLSRAVEAAVAAAVREPEPEVVASAEPAPDLKPEELDEVNEPDVTSAAPKIPTKANVAKQATFVNAINLSKTNLIGVYGSQSKRYALIRQSNGRYKKIKVGDRIEGGTVQAITENEVRYQKGGKLISLKMPKA
ncbi:translation initiation factor 2 [Tabrizicola sp.]|uniref:translation initiation factor 2 n=1 Tax=Tabrizicola sp. TaxID=2005166 RepID=UPI00286D3A5D|nr:translation initiation factor 2 [Tabrizicola sp.]